MSDDEISVSDALRAHLIDGARRSMRAPAGRFRHPWLAPMPRVEAREDASDDDRFASGDYANALFHHDVSEAAIELARDPELAEACFGSLLCFLDNAAPNGCVRRIEMPFRTRDPEPAKPCMAQLAVRAIDGIEDGLRRADAARVLPRLVAFAAYLERETTGMHGLLLTPSARASGFDSDVLTAGLPDSSVQGPDTSTFMVLELRAIAELAQRLGQDAIARVHAEKAEVLAQRIETLLWDDVERTYVALRWKHGASSRREEIVGHRDERGVHRPLRSWISMLPLYAGIAAPERAAAMLESLLDPAQHWSPWGLRTVPADDVYFHQAPRVMVYDPRREERRPVSNWSGPIWILSNYYAYRALQRYGRPEQARELARATVRLLETDLRDTGALHECYADTGRGLWPRRGTFISWNVLALTMARGDSTL
ncbi:MGH1-like glycoside hydrolase domain-containing protein [Sandaracinus amylolyticus]|uniref:Putative isomerase n=1 Tax=Sandaracinus amylolyticus TaxID=927083 RepID=A0A0F6SDQ6_9BACT|nr:trehalase family glycosidase [Sandaracinus amylolyticus]AKF03859.1 Putative isomerase [Sandaracinus amylolyticus]